MKIIPLKRHNSRHRCTSSLILGDWNRLDDINTVIDPGSDASVLDDAGYDCADRNRGRGNV
ncbi:hypothetical protein [Pelobacter propionicus]|uniref:hypothetical protein n=1 Tax=Pelobacter propionicus TaxID=29543 RepID=UPI0005A06376|nr:hypothetical protein [Pelobacter propionicus]